jgi:hypothetical protein
MRIFGIGLMCLAVFSLSACNLTSRLSRDVNRAVDLPFRANLSTGDERRDFTVTVRADGASLAEARESARYPATRHCIDVSGSSEIDWQIDPATGDWATVRSENGDLSVSGRCAAL